MKITVSLNSDSAHGREHTDFSIIFCICFRSQNTVKGSATLQFLTSACSKNRCVITEGTGQVISVEVYGRKASLCSACSENLW